MKLILTLTVAILTGCQSPERTPDNNLDRIGATIYGPGELGNVVVPYVRG